MQYQFNLTCSINSQSLRKCHRKYKTTCFEKLNKQVHNVHMFIQFSKYMTICIYGNLSKKFYHYLQINICIQYCSKYITRKSFMGLIEFDGSFDSEKKMFDSSKYMHHVQWVLWSWKRLPFVYLPQSICIQMPMSLTTFSTLIHRNRYFF